MGVCNANLTDLALATGGKERRATTGAFNLVRWGFAAPAPVLAGLLAEHVGPRAPFWVTVVVLAVGVVVFAACSHVLAPAVGERVLWARWDDEARLVEATPDEAMAEV
jgi:MFS family permease